MKTAALYCVSGISRWLPYSYQSIYQAVDGIYFFVSDRTWHGRLVDNTELLLQISSFQDAGNKIRIVSGSWQSEVEQRNMSLAYAQLDGFTHSLIIDSDEIYQTDDLLAGMEYVESNPTIECFHVKSFTYWKTLDWRIDPIEPHDPAILLKTGCGGFLEARNPIAGTHGLIPPSILMGHHLSYVLTEKELRQKHIFEPGHSQSCREDWYEQVWKKWDLNTSLENLHPVNGEWFKRAVRQPRELLPRVLKS